MLNGGQYTAELHYVTVTTQQQPAAGSRKYRPQQSQHQLTKFTAGSIHHGHPYHQQLLLQPTAAVRCLHHQQLVRKPWEPKLQPFNRWWLLLVTSTFKRMPPGIALFKHGFPMAGSDHASRRLSHSRSPQQGSDSHRCHSRFWNTKRWISSLSWLTCLCPWWSRN